VPQAANQSQRPMTAAGWPRHCFSRPKIYFPHPCPHSRLHCHRRPHTGSRHRCEHRIFTLLDQVLLRLLPSRNPAARPSHHARPPLRQQLGGNAVSHPMFRDFSRAQRSLLRHVLPLPNSASLSFGQQAERVSVELVSGTLLFCTRYCPRHGATPHSRGRRRSQRPPLRRTQL